MSTTWTINGSGVLTCRRCREKTNVLVGLDCWSCSQLPPLHDLDPEALRESGEAWPVDPQPAPVNGSAPATWDLVVQDMRLRDLMGARKYGVRHQHDNGRDHLVDLYQELLDGACYIRAEIARRAAAAARSQTPDGRAP